MNDHWHMHCGLYRVKGEVLPAEMALRDAVKTIGRNLATVQDAPRADIFPHSKLFGTNT